MEVQGLPMVSDNLLIVRRLLMSFHWLDRGLTKSAFITGGIHQRTGMNAKNKCLKSLCRLEREESARAKPQLWLRGDIRQGNQLLKPSQSAAFISLPILVLMDSPFWRRRLIKFHMQTSIKAIHLSEEPDSGNTPIKPPWKATTTKFYLNSKIIAIILQTGHIWIHPETAHETVVMVVTA